MDEPVLVVIVNYRLSGHIEDLLASGELSGHRVLLVDNGSEPDRIQGLARRYGAECLLLERNVGFAGAVNRGVAHAGIHAEVLLLNPDVHLTGTALAALRAALVARDLTGVSPLLVGSRGELQVGVAGGRATAGRVAAYFLFLSHLVPRCRGVFYTRKQLRSGLDPVWVCMACLLVRGDAFRRFGPIPEHELVYAEDLSWGVAASAAGARFGIISDVAVVHEGGAAGASRQWSGALARYVVREHGRLAGGVAAASMWTGLVLRRLAGRSVSLPSPRPPRRSRRRPMTDRQ